MNCNSDDVSSEITQRNESKTDMKTTQQLIELQRSIIEGPWLVSDDGTFPDRKYCVGRAFYCVADVGNEADATAIALVPELLAEVIRLRSILSDTVKQFDNDPNGSIGVAIMNDARALLADAK